MTTMTIDLMPAELMVVVMLANMGHSVLAGDRDAAKRLGEMLMELTGSEAIAMMALDKLEASMKLAAQITKPNAGLS